MVDLAVLRGLHPALAAVPSVAYFHENQFEYPEQYRRRGASEPLMVNLYTALSADRVVFNSDWNRRSFLDGVATYMAGLPDHRPSGLVASLERRATVLPVPVADTPVPAARPWSTTPHLVWNHRWEYDKGPDRLLALLRALRGHGQAFRLSVVGQQFRRAPDAFEAIREEFGDALVHWGYVAERAAYHALLEASDVVLSTALHDFQGLAVLEAMARGCVPLVPDRLAYPEYVPTSLRYRSLPTDAQAEAQAAAGLLVDMLARPRPSPADLVPREFTAEALLPRYAGLFEAVMRDGRGSGEADSGRDQAAAR